MASLSTNTLWIGRSRGRRPGERPVARAARGEELTDRRGVDECGAQVGGDPVPVGFPAALGFELELADGDAIHGEGAGTANALRVHAEHGHLDRQEAERVRRDQRDASRTGIDGERPVERVEVRITRGGGHGGHRLSGAAAQLHTRAFDQASDQARLPLAPCRGTGGERIGDGQRGEQVEGVLGADGVGDRGDGGRVVEVASGGEAREQKVVAYEVDEHRDVVGVEAHPRRDRLGEHHPVVGVVAGTTLAQVVQERADEQQVGPTDRSHEIVRRAPPPPGGDGRR